MPTPLKLPHFLCDVIVRNRLSGMRDHPAPESRSLDSGPKPAADASAWCSKIFVPFMKNRRPASFDAAPTIFLRADPSYPLVCHLPCPLNGESSSPGASIDHPLEGSAGHSSGEVVDLQVS